MINGLSYGPLRFEAESAKITIGKLKCEPEPPNPINQSMKTSEEQQTAINQRPDQYKMKILVFSIQYDFQILKYQYQYSI